ncbi:MAG: hypothetical protein AAF335_04980 [Bacteroidota bacterium]
MIFKDRNNSFFTFTLMMCLAVFLVTSVHASFYCYKNPTHTFTYAHVVWDGKLSKDETRVVYGGGDYLEPYKVVVYDLKSKEKKFCSVHEEPISSVGWGLHDRSIISASEDKTVCIFDIQEKKSNFFQYEGAVNDLIWKEPYKKIFSATENGKIYQTDIEKITSESFQADTKSINAISSTNENRCIAAGGDSRVVRVWDIRMPYFGNQINEYNDVGGCIRAIDLSSTHYVAFGGDDKKIYVYDRRKDSEDLLVREFRHNQGINGLSWQLAKMETAVYGI